MIETDEGCLAAETTNNDTKFSNQTRRPAFRRGNKSRQTGAINLCSRTTIRTLAYVSGRESAVPYREICTLPLLCRGHAPIDLSVTQFSSYLRSFSVRCKSPFFHMQDPNPSSTPCRMVDIPTSCQSTCQGQYPGHGRQENASAQTKVRSGKNHRRQTSRSRQIWN